MVGNLGPRRGGRPLESLGRGWSMKSLVFPRIINIYDVILWRHICNSTVTKLYDATWYLTRISDLWNCCKISREKHRISFFKYLLEKSFQNVLEKFSGRSNVFIISKRQFSLSNKFYDRNQTLQVEAISDIVRIDWPDWNKSRNKCNRGLYMFLWIRGEISFSWP